mgnify:CR=1 FL=1
MSENPPYYGLYAGWPSTGPLVVAFYAPGQTVFRCDCRSKDTPLFVAGDGLVMPIILTHLSFHAWEELQFQARLRKSSTSPR